MGPFGISPQTHLHRCQNGTLSTPILPVDKVYIPTQLNSQFAMAHEIFDANGVNDASFGRLSGRVGVTICNGGMIGGK
jgi:hypothetical protein